jgi:uncharacterized protein YycO
MERGNQKSTGVTGIIVAAAIALLQGCATQLAIQPQPDADGQEAATARSALRFQRSAVAPKGDGALLPPGDLRPGDILLTSGTGFVSASIQVLTLSPVSHAAIYIGDGKVVEAVRPEVRVRQLDDFLADEALVIALRHPELSAQQARDIRDYALQKTGTGFNFLGVTLHVQSTVRRVVCELPLMPSVIRDGCIRGIGVIHNLAAPEARLFCSQLVLQAYRQAGVPITDADPRLISPADILHMREGDVPSVRIHKPLSYVGHLRYQAPTVVAFQQ